VVGIAICYGLEGPGIEDAFLPKKKIPVGGRFSAPIQNGPGAQAASCTMGTWSFPEVKAAGA